MGEIRTDINTDNKMQKLLETNHNTTASIDAIHKNRLDSYDQRDTIGNFTETIKTENSNTTIDKIHADRLEAYDKRDTTVSNTNISQSANENSSTNTVDVSNIDFSRISSNASDAISGDFIKEENIHKEYWQGELTFIKRDDGSIQILKDGVVMGYTDAKGLNSESSSKIDEIHTSRLDSYDQRDTISNKAETTQSTTSTNPSIHATDKNDANTLLRNRLDIPFEDLGRGTTNSNVTLPFSKFAYNNQTGNYDLLRTDGSVYASYTIDVMQEICGKAVNGAVLGPSTK